MAHNLQCNHVPHSAARAPLSFFVAQQRRQKIHNMNRERLNNLEMIYNIAVAQTKWPKQRQGADGAGSSCGHCT